ncbi:MAG: T9SS type A sorting domain-containing protein [Flavobacteriales bacterium]
MKYLIFFSFFAFQISLTVHSQVLYGLLRTSNPAGVKLGTLDLLSGAYTPFGSAAITSNVNITGAALDLITNNYYFLTQGGTNGIVMSVGLDDGEVNNQAALFNPIASSSFNNFRFNNSDSTLYGLAGRYIPGPGPGLGTGELYFSSMNPATGEITQISPQSILDAYSLSGSAIDPHQMVYYFSKGTQFYGIDIYNGQVYSSQTLSFPEGGVNFANYTYNCADTTIYGIISASNTPPFTCYLGRVNPATGEVTRVSQTPLPYNTFSVNASSTIDPFTGTYYCVSQQSGGGNAVVGISVTSGVVVSVHPLTTATSGSAYFDLIRHPSDCFGAAAYRPNTNGGGGAAGIENLNPTSSKIYPNPFTDYLTIETSAKIIRLKMTDLQGKEIVIAEPLQSTAVLDLHDFPRGIYMLEIQSENSLELVKVVK